MVPAVFGAWGLALGIGFLLWMAFVNVYIVVWALGEWGVIDSSW